MWRNAGLVAGPANGVRRTASAKRTTLARLRARPLVGDGTRGLLIVGPALFPCVLGRSGIAHHGKREGDGASPRGVFRLRGGVYRPDRFPSRPRTALPLRATRPGDGWCDDPRDRRYNRPMRLPAPGTSAKTTNAKATSAETLWREDDLYDLVIDLDYNRGPIRPGRGSAIFLHLARPGFLPTEGCVALRRADLVRLLRRIGPRTRLVIG